MKTNTLIAISSFILYMTQNSYAGLFGTRASHSVPSESKTLIQSASISEQELQKTVKILSWNVKKAALNGWAQDFAKLSREYDVVAIQEAVSDSVFMDEIHRFEINFQWDYFISWIRRKSNTSSGVLTLGRANPSSVEWIRTDDLEPIVNTPKITGVTEYRIQNSTKKLKVINIHAINVTSIDKFERHLRKSLNLVKNYSGAVVFIGDFNTWSQARLNLAIKISAEYGLTQYDYKRIKVSGVHSDLDRVFVKGAVVKKVEMLDIRTSDHFPVSLEIVVP